MPLDGAARRRCVDAAAGQETGCRIIITGPRRAVTPADAPRAAQSRAVRRAWASEVNQVLRRTGDLEKARRAGAMLIMAALDVDAITARACSTGRWGRQGVRLDLTTVNLPAAARRRSANDDGAGDRIIEAILNDRDFDGEDP